MNNIELKRMLSIICSLLGCKDYDIKIDSGYGYRFAPYHHAFLVFKGERIFKHEYNANHCNSFDIDAGLYANFINQKIAIAA